MLHLRRVAQKVRFLDSVYSLVPYTEAEFSPTPQNIIRAGKRSAGLRGLATAAEPYDVVVIGGGGSSSYCGHECCIQFQRKGREDTWLPSRPLSSVCVYVIWAIFFLVIAKAEDLWNVDCLRGKAWCSRRNVSERRMYTLESYVEQLTLIPPSTTRL